MSLRTPTQLDGTAVGGERGCVSAQSESRRPADSDEQLIPATAPSSRLGSAKVSTGPEASTSSTRGGSPSARPGYGTGPFLLGSTPALPRWELAALNAGNMRCGVWAKPSRPTCTAG